MLVMSVATAKILAVKAGALFKLARVPTLLATCLACAFYMHSCFVEVDVLETNLLRAIYLDPTLLVDISGRYYKHIMIVT